MLVSLQIMLIVTLIFSSLYWVFPIGWSRFKQAYLIAISAFFIFMYNPLILALLALMTLYAVGLYWVATRYTNLRWLPWFIFAPLFGSNFLPDISWPEWLVGTPRSAAAVNWLFLGMSYYTIKTYISLKLAMKAKHLNVPAMVLANTFYPAFVSGPIDGAPKFETSVCAQPFQLREYALGWSRIGIGLFKLMIILVWIKTTLSLTLLGFKMDGTQSVDWSHSWTLQTVAYSFLSFLILYVNFSGFTDIAVGIGKMFHLHISENFRFPMLANSIQNFWQRWHLSLSSVISKYLYKPLLRKTGKPLFSIVLTFVLVGLWHRVSIGYLIWGLAHGGLLAFQMHLSKAHVISAVGWMRGAIRVFNTIVTLLAVSTLSTLANLDNAADIPAYILSYFRIW